MCDKYNKIDGYLHIPYVYFLIGQIVDGWVGMSEERHVVVPSQIIEIL